MSRNIVNTLHGIFSRNGGFYAPVINGGGSTPLYYMVVPINEEVIEVPALAFNKFYNLASKRIFKDAVVIRLQHQNGLSSYYKSIDCSIRDVLADNNKRIIKIPAKSKTGEVTYYGSYGSIFNEHMEPVMMCSWLLRKVPPQTVAQFPYDIAKPIVRISPSCAKYKDDALQKYVNGKFLTEVLNLGIYHPWERRPSMSPSVIIEDFPFQIFRASYPDINTTDRELLTCALGHINEVIV